MGAHPVTCNHHYPALLKPFLAEMTAARAAKAKRKEQETGRQTVKSGEGMSTEDRMHTTMQFSLLQLIRMGAPDMPKERIIAMNRRLNQFRKESEKFAYETEKHTVTISFEEEKNND